MNTRARGVHHLTGDDFRHVRNTRDVEAFGTLMNGSQRRGRHYTPLFRFLLSNAGEPWNEVFQEACACLDSTEPIWWLVARAHHERRETVWMGEGTHFSGLCIDADGLLRRVAPDIGPENMTPTCTCCTHTLNGVRFG